MQRMRILIYLLFLSLAILIVAYFGESVTSFFQGHNEELEKSTYFSSAIFLAMFAFVVGIGHWIIKTHEIKRQARDSFTQRNDQQISRAVELISRTGNSAAQCLGLRMLAKLRNNPNIDDSYREEIDLATSDLVIEKARLPVADLSRMKLVNARMERANLKNVNLSETDLHGSVFADANMEGVNFSKARLHKANFTRTCFFGQTLLTSSLIKKLYFAMRYITMTQNFLMNLTLLDIK